MDFNGSRMTKSFRLNNVIIGGRGSFTMRNALWPTTVIPTMTRRLKRKDSKEDGADSNLTPFMCRFIHRALSAYVLFNDEDDGFRITWITVADSIEDWKRCVLMRPATLCSIMGFDRHEVILLHRLKGMCGRSA